MMWFFRVKLKKWTEPCQSLMYDEIAVVINDVTYDIRCVDVCFILASVHDLE